MKAHFSCWTAKLQKRNDITSKKVSFCAKKVSQTFAVVEGVLCGVSVCGLLTTRGASSPDTEYT